MLPIVHVTRVDARACKEVHDVHEQLLGCVGDFCDDDNFLASGTPLEGEFEWIFGIVHRDECRIVLAHCVGSRLAVGCHELLKYFAGKHSRVPTNSGGGASRSSLVNVGDVSVEDVKAGTAYIDAGFVIVLVKGVFN